MTNPQPIQNQHVTASKLNRYIITKSLSKFGFGRSVVVDKKWVLKSKQEFTPTNKTGRDMRDSGFRNAVRTYSFEYLGCDLN
jgi:hypothetical protein